VRGWIGCDVRGRGWFSLRGDNNSVAFAAESDAEHG
jgi:hypothetical protein